MEKFFLNILLSLVIFFVITSPHILYMLTYDSDIYIDHATGEFVRSVSAIGFPYSMLTMVICAVSSGILGKLILDRI
jgi:hypothetical protein